MKVIEDSEIELTEPFLLGGSYRGAEPFPNAEEFKLITIIESPSPPMLELKFSSNGQKRSGWFKAKEGSTLGASRLPLYKKELEQVLIGHNWQEILAWDFRFDRAARLNP